MFLAISCVINLVGVLSPNLLGDNEHILRMLSASFLFLAYSSNKKLLSYPFCAFFILVSARVTLFKLNFLAMRSRYVFEYSTSASASSNVRLKRIEFISLSPLFQACFRLSFFILGILYLCFSLINLLYNDKVLNSARDLI